MPEKHLRAANAKSRSANRTIPDRVARVREIASLFDLQGPFEVSEFEGRGNINREAYLITAGPRGNRAEHLLQLLNPEVFTQPRMVMEAMVSCIQAQRKAKSAGVLRELKEWEPIRLIPTKDGRDYLEIRGQTRTECWRMMARIGCSRSYTRLCEIPDPEERIRVAEQAGRGLAIFETLTASMDASSIRSPLPGYRNTRLYYAQLDSVLAGNRTLEDAAVFLPADPVIGRSTERLFLIHIRPEEYRKRLADPQLRRHIDSALEHRSFACALHDGIASRQLKTVVVHGDTKLDNFLFSTRTGRVKALVDLDTIMPHTWLTDWGDLARSLVNIAGEREPDPRKINVDMDIFRALARGFLNTAPAIDARETDLMAEAAQIMALELGVRFLTDYLRGDSYFKLMPAEPPDLNKTRAMAQFSLFSRLRVTAPIAKRHIRELRGF